MADKKMVAAFVGGAAKKAAPADEDDKDLDTEMDTGDAAEMDEEDVPTDIEEKYGDIITLITEESDAVYDQLDMLDAETFSDPELDVDEGVAGILTDALAALPEPLVQAMVAQGAEIPWADAEGVADALVAEEVIDAGDRDLCAGFLFHGCRAAAAGEGTDDEEPVLPDDADGLADDEMA